MWIERSLEGVVRKLVRTRPDVVVTGARQVGKTSLLRRLYPEYGFVSLDFVVDRGGRLELLEAKFTELPHERDGANLRFGRGVVGQGKVAASVIACRAPNAFPLDDGIRAESPADWI